MHFVKELRSGDDIHLGLFRVVTSSDSTIAATADTRGDGAASARAPLRLSVVIPTFNERENIAELLRRLEAALGPASWEVIFVDDDSPDGTAARLRQIGEIDTRVRCLRRIRRRGLASACIEGMLAASAPAIAVMDADLQHDETRLPGMLAEIERGADLVVATRYAEGGSSGERSPTRRWMSRLATALGNAIVRVQVSDPMSGFFMLHRRVLDASVHRLSGLGFKILLDLLASAGSPLRIVEVPYRFGDRLAGESKLDEMVMWEYGMLLADKMVGRYVPARFVAFSVIGGLGVVVHVTILSLLFRVSSWPFTLAQASATGVAMVFNFALNNVLTYRDQRLRAWAWWRGLASFVLVCSAGAVANVGVASYLFNNRTGWISAALVGVLIGAVWNFAMTRVYTWGSGA